MSARGVDLEIVERTPDPGAVRQLNVISPNHVTVNGMPVLVPRDSEIEIVASEGYVLAKLTVMVGRLRVQAEQPPVDEPTPIYDATERDVYEGRV